MLLIIRQPLGAAALLSLFGGLWGAEVLACAQLQAELTGQMAWIVPWSDPGSSDNQGDEHGAVSAVKPGDKHAAVRAATARQRRDFSATLQAIRQLGDVLGIELSDVSPCQTAAYAAHAQVTGLVPVATTAGTATASPHLTLSICPKSVVLYGLGAEHG